MIDVEHQASQARKLSQAAEDIKGIKRYLESCSADLNIHWQGKELRYINDELDSVIRELNSISNTLSGVGPDVVSAAQTIRERQEEEEEDDDDDETTNQEVPAR